MSKNTLTAASTMDQLVGAYRSHVLGRTLPAPVMLNFTPALRVISVQPEGGNLCVRLANVLMWAYTLTEVTAQWWHTPDQWIQITVTGRTAGGARLRVYCGSPFGACRGLVRLAVNTSEGVSLDELYALACLLREAA